MARTGVRIADAFTEEFIQKNFAALVKARVALKGVEPDKEPQAVAAEVLQEVITSIAEVKAEENIAPSISLKNL